MFGVAQAMTIRFPGARVQRKRNDPSESPPAGQLVGCTDGEPGGIRTPNQLIKSQLLCR